MIMNMDDTSILCKFDIISIRLLKLILLGQSEEEKLESYSGMYVLWIGAIFLSVEERLLEFGDTPVFDIKFGKHQSDRVVGTVRRAGEKGSCDMLVDATSTQI